MAEGCTSAEYERMRTIKVIEQRPAFWAAEMAAGHRAPVTAAAMDAVFRG